MKLPILIFLLGLCVGILINELIVYFTKSFGVLRIDHSNPDKDVYRIEIDKLENISSKKKIVLKIDNNADLSHE